MLDSGRRAMKMRRSDMKTERREIRKRCLKCLVFFSEYRFVSHGAHAAENRTPEMRQTQKVLLELTGKKKSSERKDKTRGTGSRNQNGCNRNRRKNQQRNKRMFSKVAKRPGYAPQNGSPSPKTLFCSKLNMYYKCPERERRSSQ